MPKHAPGTPIELRWEDTTDAWLVYGHDETAAVEYAMEEYAQEARDVEDVPEDVEPDPARFKPVLGYAKWQHCDGRDDYGNAHATTLRFWPASRPRVAGSFPATQVLNPDEVEREVRRKAAEADRRARVIAGAQARYGDDITPLTMGGTDDSNTTLFFTFPGAGPHHGRGPCGYRLAEDTGWVNSNHLEAWNAWRRSKGLPEARASQDVPAAARP